MGRIAHLEMECPHCSRHTSVYIEECDAARVDVKCQHCLTVFEFGPGTAYTPVAYVAAMPAWAVIDKEGPGRQATPTPAPVPPAPAPPPPGAQVRATGVPPPAPRKSSKGLIIGIVAALLLCCCITAAGGAAWVWLQTGEAVEAPGSMPDAPIPPGAVPTAPTTGQVAGRFSGSPPSGVRLVAVEVEGDGFFASMAAWEEAEQAQVDSSGAFRFDDVEPGEYMLFDQAESYFDSGFAWAGEEPLIFEVGAGETVELGEVSYGN